VPIQHSLAAALDQALLSHSESFTHAYAARICCGTTFEGACARILTPAAAPQTTEREELRVSKEKGARRLGVCDPKQSVCSTTRAPNVPAAPSLDPPEMTIFHTGDGGS